MLRQVLKELETSTVPLSVAALSRKLGVERPVLEAMLEHLVRQGKIQDNRQFVAGDSACASGGCGSSCHGPQSCSFLANMPRAYTLANHK